ncbi:MAG: TlpA family protein disulfide reductase [Muribaculaceae bacterium]|nr:TlpA family protein disulfide reductase [Muribaculaceae bacterium]
MKKTISKIIGIGVLGLALWGCRNANSSSIEINFSDKDKYEGKTVEVVNFADSTIIATAMVSDGFAKLSISENDSVRFPIFTQIMVDGRTRAFYIVETGNAQLSDSLSVATSTPMNDKFSKMLSELDSIENLDVMDLYLDYAENAYNDNKDNPIGTYFGVEWIKYADPQRVDSFLNVAPVSFRSLQKVKQCEETARHRALTAPGTKYTDFDGETAEGKPMKLSSVVKPGKYTLVDFWASWCPYCIKELPDLQQLYGDFADKGVEIVGVAVRDKTEDTANMVAKHNIPWPVIYNTQRIPYDIYGFSGIPHHILVGPDGVIISRGESVAQIRQRLEDLVINDK